MTGTALCEPRCADFVPGVNLEVQISWQGQHFVNFEVQIWWQVEHFVNLEAQILCLQANSLKRTPFHLSQSYEVGGIFTHEYTVLT